MLASVIVFSGSCSVFWNAIFHSSGRLHQELFRFNFAAEHPRKNRRSPHASTSGIDMRILLVRDESIRTFNKARTEYSHENHA